MKLVFCTLCGDIFAPKKDFNIVLCSCGSSAAKWTDFDRGTMHVACNDGPNSLRIIGIENEWLDTWKMPEWFVYSHLSTCPLKMFSVDSTSEVTFNNNLFEDYKTQGKTYSVSVVPNYNFKSGLNPDSYCE